MCQLAPSSRVEPDVEPFSCQLPDLLPHSIVQQEPYDTYAVARPRGSENPPYKRFFGDCAHALTEAAASTFAPPRCTSRRACSPPLELAELDEAFQILEVLGRILRDCVAHMLKILQLGGTPHPQKASEILPRQFLHPVGAYRQDHS